jgi:hypothetical protein
MVRFVFYIGLVLKHKDSSCLSYLREVLVYSGLASSTTRYWSTMERVVRIAIFLLIRKETDRRERWDSPIFLYHPIFDAYHRPVLVRSSQKVF